MAHSQILVLEDKEFVRDVWVDGLEEAGYSVVGMASGTEALARLPKLNPQLILLDIKMPDMDGIQFLARLRTPARRRQAARGGDDRDDRHGGGERLDHPSPRCCRRSDRERRGRRLAGHPAVGGD